MLFRSDRTTVRVALVCVVALAWLYLLSGAGVQMGAGDGRMTPMEPTWTPGYAALVFCMWAVMMVAMMLPSAAPAILSVAGLVRKHSGQTSGLPASILYTTGNLAVWTGFSVAATLAQWGLDRAGLLSEAMRSRSAAAAGFTLVVAGLYQLTPFKQTCLRQCRRSLDRLDQDWRVSARGTVATGLRHGLFGLGSCGALMGLLFVGGVMNVVWIAGLALLLLVEQTRSWGTGVSRVTGGALMAWGSMALARTMFYG